jgi:hypothetical protein
MLVWKDGTWMTIDDGRGPRTTRPCAQQRIKDVFFSPYPLGRTSEPPGERRPGPRPHLNFNKIR